MPPSRRDLLRASAAGAAFGLSGCGASHRRPGRLIYLLRDEPYTLDPAKSPGAAETWILSALFEPLLEQHPVTTAPIAGLVTHYLINAAGTRYTFFLRGNPAPEGIQLAGAGALSTEFTRARHGAPFAEPARWSDGVPVTADDVVFSCAVTSPRKPLSSRRTACSTSMARKRSMRGSCGPKNLAFARLILLLRDQSSSSGRRLPPTLQQHRNGPHATSRYRSAAPPRARVVLDQPGRDGYQRSVRPRGVAAARIRSPIAKCTLLRCSPPGSERDSVCGCRWGHGREPV